MSDPNGRRDNRSAVEWPAKVGGHGASVEPALVRNVSLSGMYLETKAVLEVQNRILLESHVEHSGKIRRLLVECEVMRRTATEKAEVHGYGVRFTKLGRENLSFLLPLVAELWTEQKKSPSADRRPTMS